MKITFVIICHQQPLKNPGTKSWSHSLFFPLPISFFLLSQECLLFTFSTILALFYTVAYSLVSTLPVSPTHHPQSKPEQSPYKVDLIKTVQTYNDTPLSAEESSKSLTC